MDSDTKTTDPREAEGERAEDWAKAREELERAANDPSSYAKYNTIANELAKGGQFADADKLWGEAVTIGQNAQSSARWLALEAWAKALDERKDYEGERSKLGEAIQLAPDDERRHLRGSLAFALWRWANALAEGKDYQQAVAKLREAIQLPLNAAIFDDLRESLSDQLGTRLREWVQALIQQKDYDSAAAKLREAVALGPDDWQSYHNCNEIAEAYEKAGRFVAADQLRQEFVDVGEQAHASARSWVLAGWAKALGNRNQYDAARDKILAALKADPDDLLSYSACNTLADTLVQANRPEEAERLWHDVAVLGEKTQSKYRSIAFMGWGTALHERKDYEGAAAKLKAAIELDPDNGTNYLAYDYPVIALSEANQFDRAEQLWQEGITLGEEAKSSHRLILLRSWGRALTDRKDYDKAAEKLFEALKLGPDIDKTYEAYLELGSALVDSKQLAKAEQRLQEALEVGEKAQPENRSALLALLGLILLERRAYSDAADKLRASLNISSDAPFVRLFLGDALAEQGYLEEALKEYKEALNGSNSADKDRKWPLARLARACAELERFDEGLAFARQAVTVDTTDAQQYFDLGNILSCCGLMNEAISDLERSIAINRDDPLPHHYRADLLFRSGRYKEGWQESRIASNCYEKMIDKASSEHVPELAHNFAKLLAYVYQDYPGADKYFALAVESGTEDAAMWRDMAMAYAQWANASGPPVDVQIRFSRAVQKAIELGRNQLGGGNDFPVMLTLADLHIEADDPTTAQDCLEQAAQMCRDSRLRRADVERRKGRLDFRAGRYDDAVECFRKAVSVHPEDIELRATLGKAMLLAKKLGDARQEFDTVLKSAPGHIDALLDDARACIELAEGGAVEQYREAEQQLSKALQFGRDADAGSCPLVGSQLEEVYYLRGYARTQRWEKEGRAAIPLTLLSAVNDFSRCPTNRRAADARAKILGYLEKRTQENILTWLGSIIVFLSAVFVFVFVQATYFFEASFGHALLPPSLTGGTYGALTFGALLFMVAALSIPNLLKLKVVGVLELEKGESNELAAPRDLDIVPPKAPVPSLRPERQTESINDATRPYFEGLAALCELQTRSINDAINDAKRRFFEGLAALSA